MSDKLKINKAYAESYNKWRQKEELAKLKNKYSEVVSESDSEDSSSESEDDDAEGLTEEIDKDWLKTLSALKSKDPIIYQKDVQFYHDEGSKSGNDKKRKKEKHKPVYLKDYERQLITEKGGVLPEESNDEEEISHTETKGYHEEQEDLRKSLLAAAADSDSDDDDGDDGLIKTKSKSKAQKYQDSSEDWLANEKEDETEKTEPLKSYWNNPSLDDGEKFLRDYILGKKYIDNEENGLMGSDEESDRFSEEEELLAKQETFERKYNFRFEEPDADQLKTYPRNLEDTVRRKNTKRAEKRQKAKERKLQEKATKKEEIKQLKNLKKQEILDKLDKLREITGNKDLAIKEDEFEKDFDPEEYDRMMQEQFDESYYDHGGVEDVKPVFQDSGDEYDDGQWDDWQGDTANYEPHVDDPDFNMDADYDPAAAPKKSKKKKKKNKLAQALDAKKPVYDPEEKSFEQYLDDYYKLDYEDIIDGMPCRFKYRKTLPNDYGLSVDEILDAREKELNAWASLKKMSQYRSEQEEEADLSVYTRKGKNQKKKRNILSSLYQPTNEDSSQTEITTPSQNQDKGIEKDRLQATQTESHDSASKVTHKKGSGVTATATSETVSKEKKNKKKKRKTLESEGEVPVKKQKSDFDLSTGKKQETASISFNLPKEQKKGKKKKKNKDDRKLKMSEERLKAYGINPQKYKYMKKDELFRFKSGGNE